MNLYFAPMEGITGCVYRSTHREVFGGCSAYFAPFITPSDNEKVSKKGLKDVLFENNKGFPLKVQVLTNQSEAFIKFANKIKAHGYNEINLNLGCPSATVVGKGRGAGMLAEPYKLDKFLYEIFSKCDIKISIKTRIGYEERNEIEDLMNIYNKYPISLLIVHPRTRMEFYKGIADVDAFKYAYSVSKNNICYNGDVCSKEDFQVIKNQFPDAEGVMIGRGALKNPALFREISGGPLLKTDELITFSEKLTENYLEFLGSETFTLHKLKEVCYYMLLNFPEEKKISKAVKKANKLTEFTAAIECLPQI